MATAQATLMGFNDYQGQLAAVNVAILAGNWGGAYKGVAMAQVILAGMPEEAITGQKTTKFRMIKELADLRDSISSAQIASATGGAGTGIGHFEFARAT